MALIDRQAAIDAVLDRMNIEKYGRDAKPEEIRWTLEKLPPVQSDVPVINVGDMISREDAIKAICEDGTWLERQGCTEITMAERKQRDADIIGKLPSVQPTLMRSIGKLVGYTGNKCPNCGRLRVERYESGLEICEKCNWCEQTKSYWLDWEEG